MYTRGDYLDSQMISSLHPLPRVSELGVQQEFSLAGLSMYVLLGIT